MRMKKLAAITMAAALVTSAFAGNKTDDKIKQRKEAAKKIEAQKQQVLKNTPKAELTPQARKEARIVKHEK